MTENTDNLCEGKKKGVLIKRDSLEAQHLCGDLNPKLLAWYKWWLSLPGREHGNCKGQRAGMGMARQGNKDG